MTAASVGVRMRGRARGKMGFGTRDWGWGQTISTCGLSAPSPWKSRSHSFRRASSSPGVLHVPDGARAPRPAFPRAHGFGSNKDSGGTVATARLYASTGYTALRTDMRGCGEERRCTRACDLPGAGRGHPERPRISHCAPGGGPGPHRDLWPELRRAEFAVCAAGVDERFSACVSSGGWETARRSSESSTLRRKRGSGSPT